jgi:F-type H+-transporting ATPase subunit a
MSASSHSVSILQQIPGMDQFDNNILVASLVVVLLLGLSFKMAGRYSRTEERIVPESKLTLTNAFEILGEKIYGLVIGTMGKHEGPHYFPLIGTIFLYIFLMNFMGLIPGFGAPTSDLNATLALGSFVFIYYNYVGFKVNGLAYLKHFAGPMIYIAPLMFVIEVLSHLFRPISLALRLRGNIDGDHIVLGIFSDLVPQFIPIIFYGLGLFVALIQAFVFSLMTMVYISLSTAHDH